MKNKIYSIVRFVQSADDDYNRIEAVFSGISLYYCEGNSQPVIDYLSDWDDEENELSPNIDSLTVEDWFYVYMTLMSYIEGDHFYRSINDGEPEDYERDNLSNIP